jgi:hypothetical protein
MDSANPHSDSPVTAEQRQNTPQPIFSYQQQVQKESGRGFFGPEKRGIQKGIVGGIVMIVIAVVWFAAGYAAGIIFYYPPILLLIGLYALIKGIITGNVSGEKAGQPYVATADTGSVDIKGFSSLFDRNRFGMNIYAGLGYFVASVLSLFTWRIVNFIIHEHSVTLPIEFYLIAIVFTILESAMFLFLCHGIKRDWILTIFFSLGMVALGILQTILLSAVVTSVHWIPALEIKYLIKNFVQAVLLIGGLVAIAKLRLIQLWGFALGMMIASLCSAIAGQITLIGSDFSVSGLLPSAINGIFLGLLVYAGLVLHLRKRGFQLNPAAVVQIG